MKRINNIIKLKPKITITIVIIFITALSLTVFLYKSNKAVVSGIETPSVQKEIPGWWYDDHFGSSVCEKDICKNDSDPDKDGLTNQQEFYYHSNPVKADTNGNGLDDGEDVSQNFDPSRPGKITFEQVASDDNIVGESLAFGDDIKKIVSDLTKPKEFDLTSISESTFNISQNNTKENLVSYLKNTNNIYGKYIPGGIDSLDSLLAEHDQDTIDSLKLKSAQVYSELLKIEVPLEAVNLHKYELGFIKLIPRIVEVPSEEDINDLSNTKANAWYDDVKMFTSIKQKSDLELYRLSTKYENL
jgi:hypothetical protein